jgi:uncharacterized protein YcbX
MTETDCKIVSLYRYPVKGLSAEPMAEVDVKPGETIPADRMWAIENGPGRFDPDNPRHLPKINFLMLMRDERLATLSTRYDVASRTLTIERAGKQVAHGDLGTVLGRQMIEQFFAAYMKASLRGPPKIVSSPGHSFSDMPDKCVHIVNLATVRELERVAERPLDPLRFRGNIYVDGLEPWAELAWLDQEIVAGDDRVRLSVFHRTQRCDATNVDPATGVRDTAIPALLQRTWGHANFGIYAHVASPGRLMPGSKVSVAQPA